MAHMFARASVGSYDAFRGVFDGHEDMRRMAGVTGKSVYRSVDDPNEVTVRLDFPDPDAAKAFASSERLKAAMKEAGVRSAPTIWFVEET